VVLEPRFATGRERDDGGARAIHELEGKHHVIGSAVAAELLEHGHIGDRFVQLPAERGLGFVDDSGGAREVEGRVPDARPPRFVDVKEPMGPYVQYAADLRIEKLEPHRRTPYRNPASRELLAERPVAGAEIAAGVEGRAGEPSSKPIEGRRRHLHITSPRGCL
jgi:hypothetical protein